MEWRHQGLLAEAWHVGRMVAWASYGKSYPTSPAALWRGPPSQEDINASLIAGAKARFAAQEAAKAGKQRDLIFHVPEE